MVSNLRLDNAVQERYCSFIMGKSLVALLKKTTIPRLELTAVTVAVRTNRMYTFLWTMLHIGHTVYIQKRTARFDTFVANRLAIIQNGSHTSERIFIKTKFNPADHASKGQSADSLVQEEKWIKAPNFLLGPEEQWPKEPLFISAKTITENDPEVAKCYCQGHHHKFTRFKRKYHKVCKKSSSSIIPHDIY